MTVVIRSATFCDLPAINDIYNEAVAKTIATFDTEPKSLEDRQKWFTSRLPKHEVIVLEVEGEVRGWASLNQYSDRQAYHGTVENSIYIFEKYWGLRYGTMLLESLLQKGRENGFHTVLSRISNGNVASIKLHEKYGFETIGTMKEVGYKFGNYIDVTMMQKIFT